MCKCFSILIRCGVSGGIMWGRRSDWCSITLWTGVIYPLSFSMMWGVGWVDLGIVVIFFCCGDLEMAGEVTAACIVSICLLNTTGSCFLLSWWNFQDARMVHLGLDFVKCVQDFLLIQWLCHGWRKRHDEVIQEEINSVFYADVDCVIFKNFKTSIVVNSVTQIPAINTPNCPASTNWWFFMYNHTSSWRRNRGSIEVACSMHLCVSISFRFESWFPK